MLQCSRKAAACGVQRDFYIPRPLVTPNTDIPGKFSSKSFQESELQQHPSGTANRRHSTQTKFTSGWCSLARCCVAPPSMAHEVRPRRLHAKMLERQPQQFLTSRGEARAWVYITFETGL
ncbi:uncharacterized protein LOC119431172 isoform X1 [Dermacentor silvarum]|uniref:uncharacterized protein LOC119431172 isoform X1 n=1 Tax=Dermacentor silvarum TaxID=543639 RepID=UPI002101092E|nr:uncharacterized protein LOC119431172 isoform X1 [Dermacentor silvarum]